MVGKWDDWGFFLYGVYVSIGMLKVGYFRGGLGRDSFSMAFGRVYRGFLDGIRGMGVL